MKKSTRKLQLIAAGLICVCLSSMFMQNATATSGDFTTPLEVEASTEVLCHFENNFNDAAGGASGSNRYTSFTSSNPITGSYSDLINGDTEYVRWVRDGLQDQGTIECYVTLYSLRENDIILSGGENVYNQYGKLYVTITGGKLAGTHGSPTGTLTKIIGTTTLQTNVLYHIIYSWGPLGRFLILNNHLEVSDSETQGLSASSRNFGIGKVFSKYDYTAAQGIYDEFRLSNQQIIGINNNLPGLTSLNSLNEFKDTIILNHGTQTPDSGKEILGDSIIAIETSTAAEDGSCDQSNKQEGTVEVYFRPQNVDTNGNNQYIIGAQTTTKYPCLAITMNNGQVFGKHNTGSVWSPLLTNSDNLLNSGEIYHILYTWGSFGTFLYINDILMDSQAIFYPMSNSILSAGVGRVPTNAGAYAAIGEYDDFRYSETQHLSLNPLTIDEHTKILGRFDGTSGDSVSNSFTHLSSSDSNYDTTSQNIVNFGKVQLTGYDGYATWGTGDIDLLSGSIETYYTPTHVDFSSTHQYILGIEGDNYYPLLTVMANNGYIQAKHHSGAGWSSQIQTTTSILHVGQTYHIAYTWGSGGTKLYINGILEAASSDTRRLAIENRLAGVGQVPSITGSGAAEGFYDEFRLSSIARVYSHLEFTRYLNSDSDELLDWQENIYESDIFEADSDGDGLEDGEEINPYGTDPTDADSDGDGHFDGVEALNGFSPLDPDETPFYYFPYGSYQTYAQRGPFFREENEVDFDSLKTTFGTTFTSDWRDGDLGIGQDGTFNEKQGDMYFNLIAKINEDDPDDGAIYSTSKYSIGALKIALKIKGPSGNYIPLSETILDEADEMCSGPDDAVSVVGSVPDYEGIIPYIVTTATYLPYIGHFVTMTDLLYNDVNSNDVFGHYYENNAIVSRIDMHCPALFGGGEWNNEMGLKLKICGKDLFVDSLQTLGYIPNNGDVYTFEIQYTIELDKIITGISSYRVNAWNSISYFDEFSLTYQI
ncbi:LamG-like jellyroll fold domain-containing protein [Candidatus Lokiarchaeum ossiferum]|uniref:LamG-like jellyroll fold domain-containing protein n=1 Tax=Candidatus Lokiarchaeum ossiferum TaxID=2951803 RepID=UPI00352D08C3